MKLLKKVIRLFSKKVPDRTTEPDILFPGLVSAKQFALFEPHQRMQAVVIVGDSGNVKFCDFIKWCIEYDPDLGVRLAALQRLPNYLGQTDLPGFLKYLSNSSHKLVLEPYLSITLVKFNITAEDELNTGVNDQ